MPIFDRPRLERAARRVLRFPNARFARRETEAYGTSLDGLRIVFAVTTGRSGTTYLRDVANILHDVQATHEPAPCFHDVMRIIQTEPQVAVPWLTSKVHRLRYCPSPVYLEASHLFCKGFLEPWIDVVGAPDLIMWKRDSRKVALSLHRLGAIPGLSERALRWYLAPGDPDTYGVEDLDGKTDYQRCFWYVREIERRQQAYGERVESLGARTLRMDVEALNATAGFETLTDFLRGSPPDRLERLAFQRLVGKPVNLKAKRKKTQARPDPTDLDAQEQALDAALIPPH